MDGALMFIMYPSTQDNGKSFAFLRALNRVDVPSRCHN